jgi:NTP pyrophosphatase (non-canonical NTP hydrolase)
VLAAVIGSGNRVHDTTPAQPVCPACFTVARVEAPPTVRRMDAPVPTDRDARLEELKQRVLAFAHERDWEQFHSPKNLSMALAAEAAELMENFLWMTPEESRDAAGPAAKRRQAIEDELADIVIYALQFANQSGIDVARAIAAKMAVNARKYPVEKARGRSDKYTEL